ncbi:MAG TPA: hypothetical protein VN452_04910 [Longilinea sp.]|nr:hypothetical protein [Longilinea sp.]
MPSWIVLAPVLLLIVAAGGIFLLDRLRPNFGLAWLIAMLAGIINWGMQLFYRFRTPMPFQLADWLPFAVRMDDRLLFQVDTVSWPLAFSLSGLLLAVILTAPVRLGQKSYPIAWASNLVIASMGLVGVLSGNLITLLLVWSLIDVVELVIMLRTVHEPRLNRQVVIAFEARVSGTIVALAAFVYGQSLNIEAAVSAFPQASALLLAAAGLRLGVLPLNLPYQQEIQMHRGVGTSLRMASAATSLVLLARLTSPQLSTGATFLLLLSTAIASLYAAAMWVGAANELNGRPYWIVATAGLAITCVINGSPVNSLVWSTSMILSGGVLFLYSARARFSLVLPILAALAVIGLPFTPTASGWAGLLGENVTLFGLVMVLVVALLVVGLLRHALLPGDSLKDMQGWIQVGYPLGLFILASSSWIIAITGSQVPLIFNNWPASVAAFILVLGLGVLILRRQRLIALERRITWLDAILQAAGRWLARFFGFRWLYTFLRDFMGLVRRLVEGFSLVLEGEGGVLWAMVLLALLLTLLIPGIGQ